MHALLHDFVCVYEYTGLRQMHHPNIIVCGWSVQIFNVDYNIFVLSHVILFIN